MKKECRVLVEKKKKEKREKKIKKMTEGEKNRKKHIHKHTNTHTHTHTPHVRTDLTKVFTSIMHYSYCSCTSLSLKIRN